MHLSVYGDSIAAAYGLNPAQGFVPKLANHLSTYSQTVTRYFNFGQDGMTSWELASAFLNHADWWDGLRGASAICILIGGDDLIQEAAILLGAHSDRAQKRTFARSRTAYLALLAAASSLKNKSARLAVGTLYNPFPQTPAAEAAINLYNTQIILPAAKRYGVPVAPIHAAFAGAQAELILGYKTGVAGTPGNHGVRYPIHPNAHGQTVIAGAFASTLVGSLPSPKQ